VFQKLTLALRRLFLVQQITLKKYLKPHSSHPILRLFNLFHTKENSFSCQTGKLVYQKVVKAQKSKTQSQKGNKIDQQAKFI